MHDAIFETDRRAPLDWHLAPEPSPPSHLTDLVVERFELASRGDRVPGRLLRRRTPGRAPLVLLQHGAGGAKDAPYLDAVAAPWVRKGAAVASIDFPLHGERASAKLTAKLLTALGAGRLHAGDGSEALAIELARQAVHDLRRTLDALAAHPQVDVGRCAYVGLSLGAILGTAFCAVDPRPCAAVLALGGGGFLPAPIDPTTWVGRIAPRPILFVNASRDETVPRAATEQLVRAAGSPHQVRWFDAGHSSLPGVALKAMWEFLAERLAVDR